jgi:ABC-type Fe3+/spermidine/putrescine transport system ATPase subunit
MGMVFQSYAVWPHMTVEQNIAFGLKLQKLSASEISQRVEEALVLVGLATHAKRAIHALSGGQQQRVALARAIALQPRVLLFDEPLSNLDAQLRERMRFDLRQLQQRLGITAIYVTHDQQEAMVIADRIVLMNAGRIVQIGTPRQIYREPATQFAANFVGQANSLNATVIEASETTTVRIDGGLLLTSLQTGFEIGERLRVVLRPEEILLSLDQSTGLNRVRTTVERCTFLGNIAEVWLNVGETQLRAQISPARDWEAGQIATLSIDPAAVSLVPLL